MPTRPSACEGIHPSGKTDLRLRRWCAAWSGAGLAGSIAVIHGGRVPRA
ncbi:hypothetical protein AB0G02_33880 [Actinosynnema sp. NPDC023658]